MKTLLKSFSGQVMSKEQMKTVQGAGGCFDGWYACQDACYMSSHAAQELQLCLMDCWGAAVGEGCNEY
jgi:hypothetical protein